VRRRVHGDRLTSAAPGSFIGMLPQSGGRNLRAAAGYEIPPTRSGRRAETPGRFVFASCLVRRLTSKDEKATTGQTLVVASHHIGRRPRGIPVLSDFFNPLGLGNSFPSPSPSSDSSFLASGPRKKL